MDLATLIKPILTGGDLRVIGSTTFEEYKQIEKDRALARRLQKIAIDEPSIQETVRILAGLRSRYEEHHGVKYTDAALEAAAKLAARHLRDYKLPDSAIDIIDEAGAVTKIKHQASGAGHQASASVPPAASPASASPGSASASASGGASASASASAFAFASASTPVVDAADIETIVARMARIPARQASSSDRERLRMLEESLGPRGVWPGRCGASGGASN